MAAIISNSSLSKVLAAIPHQFTCNLLSTCDAHVLGVYIYIIHFLSVHAGMS